MSPDSESAASARASNQRRREPSLAPPSYILNQHGARVLDPTTAVRAPGQPTVRATVYVGSQLRVRDADVEAVREPLTRAASELKLNASFAPLDPQLHAVAEQYG